MHTLALVQARMGSTRLPGKMMMDLCGYPVLHWVLYRLKRATGLAGIVLATTDLERDEPLAELALGLGIQVFRGSETDVLGRFIAAARRFGADPVVRVCADNPMIAPEEIDRLISLLSGQFGAGGRPGTALCLQSHTGLGQPLSGWLRGRNFFPIIAGAPRRPDGVSL